MSSMLIAFAPQGEDACVYGPGSQAYSPQNSDVAAPTGYPNPVANHKVNVTEVSDYPYLAVAPKPPDPAVGGEHGPTRQLGWTTGLRPVRWGHQMFTGMAIRAPANQANPKTGNVGFSNASGRRAAGVSALLNDRTPTNEAVSALFGANAKPNAITGEVQAIR